MNTEQPEPLAAVLAEMRDFADHRAADAGGERPGIELLRSYADRIEAAAERERDEDRQLAAIAESDEAFARCARCDRPERVPGNASSRAPMSLDEAIEHAESRADETPCGQAHAQLAGWLRELRDLRNATGNAAAMRAALNQLRDWALLDINENAIRSDEPNYKKLVDGIVEITNNVLAAPARNCDRFSTELDARLAWKREAHCKGDYRYWLFAPAEGGDHD